MLQLPPQIDAAAALQGALSRQVAFVPGEEFHLNGAGRNTIRLNFTNAPPERILEGVRRLGEALKDRRLASVAGFRYFDLGKEVVF
jgi:2-aminoadipate transaminase